MAPRSGSTRRTPPACRVAPIQAVDRVLADPQVRHRRGWVAEVEHPGRGATADARHPIKIDGKPGSGHYPAGPARTAHRRRAGELLGYPANASRRCVVTASSREERRVRQRSEPMTSGFSVVATEGHDGRRSGAGRPPRTPVARRGGGSRRGAGQWHHARGGRATGGGAPGSRDRGSGRGPRGRRGRDRAAAGHVHADLARRLVGRLTGKEIVLFTPGSFGSYAVARDLARAGGPLPFAFAETARCRISRARPGRPPCRRRCARPTCRWACSRPRARKWRWSASARCSPPPGRALTRSTSRSPTPGRSSIRRWCW